MIVSVLLMELKSIASKWKNNIALISRVMAILYNRSIISSTTVIKWKKMLLFYRWFSILENNKEAEWSEKSLKHMYIYFHSLGLTEPWN